MKKIFVVEDDPDINNTISIMLRMEGYEVSTSQDGWDALKKIFAVKPDLIIMDIVLPGLKGTELSAILKKDPQCNNIPVIFITAQAQKSDMLHLQESAKDNYLIKPFDLEQLKEKIDKMLKIGQEKK